MKFRIPEVFLGVLLTIAVLALGMSLAVFPPKQATEQTNHSNQTAEKPNKVSDSEGADERVAKYTLWLAILTGGLVAVSGFQGYFLIRSDKTSRISAEAARKSADAAIKASDASFAAERARCFIVIEEHNLSAVIANVESRGTIADGENFWIRYRFQNYGKTPAIIKALTLNSMIAAEPVDPPINPLSSKNFQNT